ncbi:hypothetical protein PG991_003445 [Apiospora marii]|uniref:Uncharacterized protein n=1 Tax=Apiospora marii TaxID=335849 RepID=A0ABR1S3C7_9PEZI
MQPPSSYFESIASRTRFSRDPPFFVVTNNNTTGAKTKGPEDVNQTHQKGGCVPTRCTGAFKVGDYHRMSSGLVQESMCAARALLGLSEQHRPASPLFS